MAFWERNFILIGAVTVLAAALYFGTVVWQSLTLGSVATPSLLLVLGCILLQVFGSMLLVGLWASLSGPNDEATRPADGMDERDRFVKLKSESSSAHFYLLFFLIALLGWFVHEDAAILFHSFVGAFFLGDLVRSGFQLLYYNKAY